MKHLKLVVLVLLMMSCTKQPLKHEPTKPEGVAYNIDAYPGTGDDKVYNNNYPSHIASYTTVAYAIPAGIAATVAEYGTYARKIIYDNTNLISYIMNSKYTVGKALVVYSKSGINIGAIATTKPVSAGINSYLLSSTSGQPYYGMQYNTSNQFRYFVAYDTPMPWGKWGTDPEGRQTFKQCMQERWSGCSASWSCSIACGLSFPECALGMGIACSGRIVCPACFNPVLVKPML